MATIITHPIIPLAAAYLIGREKISTRLIIFAGIASIIPDVDVISFNFGIGYGDPYGHRGFTHSVAFSVFLGLFACLFANYFKTTKTLIFSMIFIGASSHGILDALTDGGYGVAFFWPIDNSRYFFPIRPIEVSPIGLKNFLTPRGLEVLWSELWLIWLPSLTVIFLKIIKTRSSN